MLKQNNTKDQPTSIMVLVVNISQKLSESMLLLWMQALSQVTSFISSIFNEIHLVLQVRRLDLGSVLMDDLQSSVP